MDTVEIHTQYEDESDLYSAHLPGDPYCHPSWCVVSYVPLDVADEWIRVQKEYYTIQGGMEFAHKHVTSNG